jgi:type IV pilus biogenesis protein CpaD/CtpE
MKKLTLFLVLLVVFSMILIAGCTQQQSVVTSKPKPVKTALPTLVIPTLPIYPTQNSKITNLTNKTEQKIVHLTEKTEQSVANFTKKMTMPLTRKIYDRCFVRNGSYLCKPG